MAIHISIYFRLLMQIMDTEYEYYVCNRCLLECLLLRDTRVFSLPSAILFTSRDRHVILEGVKTSISFR